MNGHALLDAALDYAERGFTVIPLGAGKVPAAEALEARYGSRKWTPLQTRPPSRADLEFLCSHPTTRGVGLICGVPDRTPRRTALAVVDFDQEAPAGLDLPATPTVKTSRGRHLYFHLDCPASSARLGGGLGEVRAARSYVVAPPSHHASGAIYSWEVGLDRPLAPFSAFARSLDLLQPVDVSLELRSVAVPVQLLTGGGDLQCAERLLSVATLDAIRSDESFRGAWLRSWEADADYAGAVAEHAGFVGVGRKGSCVIPGHGPDRDPSAAVFSGTAGHRYMDFHRRGLRDSYPLTSVYAFVTAGQEWQLSDDDGYTPEFAVWKLRAPVDLGFHRPVSVELPRLSPRAGDVAHRARTGFAHLVAVRSIASTEEPVPFTPNFLVRWCSLVVQGFPSHEAALQAAEEAIRALRVAKVVTKVDETVSKSGRRINLYLPGPGASRPHRTGPVRSPALTGATPRPADNRREVTR